MDSSALWQATLNELKLQMTKSTFDMWLKNSSSTGVEDGALTIRVHSTYAKDWLENRLYDTIIQTAVPLAAAMDQPPVTGLQFVVGAEFALPEKTAMYETAVSNREPPQPAFPGFEPIRSNFVQVPRQFFEIVLVDGPYVMRVFVGVVIAHTYGKILNFRTMERAEWWEANRAEIARATGIKSPTSVDRAIHLARARGFVIRGDGNANYRYRPREENEDIDTP